MPHNKVTEFAISPDGLSFDHPEFGDHFRHFGLYVVWRGGEWWAVKWGSEVLTHDLEFVYDAVTSHRYGEDLIDVRFTCQEGLTAAEQVVNKIVVNGKTWAEWEACRAEVQR